MGFFSHRAEGKRRPKMGVGERGRGREEGKGKNEKGGNAREPAITHTRNSHKKERRKEEKKTIWLVGAISGGLSGRKIGGHRIFWPFPSTHTTHN